MKYIVHTRGEMESVSPQHAYVVLSIGTPGDEEARLCVNEHCRGVLRLWFDDADKEDHFPLLLLRDPEATEATQPIKLFDNEDADRILDFWTPLRHSPEVIFYIHCHAGHSRSPAIAAALQKIETGDDNFWFATKRPNMLIYRTLLNRAFDRELYQP